jgi:hypothetical protein
MGRIRMSAACFVLALTANAALAQGTIEWDKGRPRTGSVAGSIEVKGTIKLEPGWSLMSANVVAEVWQSGGVLERFHIAIERRHKTWGVFRIQGLKPGASYNVIVIVSVTDGARVENLTTAAKIVQTAK